MSLPKLWRRPSRESVHSQGNKIAAAGVGGGTGGGHYSGVAVAGSPGRVVSRFWRRGNGAGLVSFRTGNELRHIQPFTSPTGGTKAFVVDQDRTSRGGHALGLGIVSIVYINGIGPPSL